MIELGYKLGNWTSKHLTTANAIGQNVHTVELKCITVNHAKVKFPRKSEIMVTLMFGLFQDVMTLLLR